MHPVASRHTLHLPDGRVVAGVYYPAPLRAGDLVTIGLETYSVERSSAALDPQDGAVVTAKLILLDASPDQP